MICIAHGIVNWTREERQTDRYGKFYLDGSPFSNGPSVVLAKPWCDAEAVARFQGKKVRMRCVVVESRVSEHAGDGFLGIKPSRPEVGEEIDLGVGVFLSETLPYDDDTTVPLFVLMPEVPRDQFWIDPRKLYRLHSQTVNLMIEETSEACSPVPDLTTEISEAEMPMDPLHTPEAYLNCSLSEVIEELGLIPKA